MDRNSIIGIIFIFLIMVVFFTINQPSKEERARLKLQQDSIAWVMQQEKMKAPEMKNSQDKKFMIADTLKNDSSKKEFLHNEYGCFSQSGNGSNKFYTIENNLIKIAISNKGGRPYSVEIKKYKTFDKKPLILFDGDSTRFGLNFASSENKTISTNDLYFVPVSDQKEIVVNGKDSITKFALRLYAGEKSYIEYVYTLASESYLLKFDINFVGMQDIIAPNWSSCDFNWEMNIPAQEKGRKNENNYTTIMYKHSQEEMVEMSANVKPNESKEAKISTRVKWVAFKDQFFSSVLIANNYFENASLKSTMIQEPSPYLKNFTAFLSVPIEHKSNYNIPLKIYFGPNHFNTLKSYNEGLEEIVGMGRWIVKYINRWAIIPVFNFLNRFINNYGIIILLLTIILKLVLFPLTYKSYLSQAKMKVLKPQIDEINAKIPKDKAMERQQATMALYRKVGVSPLGGCLPMLLQFPILIAMFRFFPTSFELRQQSFLWATDLSTYDSIFEWQAHIPLISDFYGNHISLFTILMTAATIITIQMSNQANTTTQMPGMKTMTYIMPFMFMFMLNNFSAGLTYYYFLANMITIGQNYAFKSVVDEEELLRKLNDNKKKPAQRSKFQEKLEQMAKQRGYKLPKK